MIDLKKKTKRLEFVSWVTFFILGFVCMSLMIWSTVLDVIKGYNDLNDVEVETTSLDICDVSSASRPFFKSSNYIFGFETVNVAGLGSNVTNNNLVNRYVGSFDFSFSNTYLGSFPTVYLNFSVDVFSHNIFQGVGFDGRSINTSWIGSSMKFENRNEYLYYGYRFSSLNFVFDISYISIVVTDTWGNNSNLNTTSFYFYDVNGNSFQFAFLTPKNYYVLEDRSFFLTTSLTEDVSYTAGYVNGTNYGYDLGSQDGYINGYNVGLSVGKDEGFQDGVLHANDYSFLGLIGAVVDVPIQSITSLLNFEIFGFNFFSLFTGLITISIIFVFVRLVFFRK